MTVKKTLYIKFYPANEMLRQWRLVHWPPLQVIVKQMLPRRTGHDTPC